ncbi:hypothetical protein HC762_01305 [bacterium]|nr:hypothetical protein [bacterium]
MISLKTDPELQTALTQLRQTYFPETPPTPMSGITLFRSPTIPPSQLEQVETHLTDIINRTPFKSSALELKLGRPFKKEGGVYIRMLRGQKTLKILHKTLSSTWPGSGPATATATKPIKRANLKTRIPLIEKCNNKARIQSCLTDLQKMFLLRHDDEIVKGAEPRNRERILEKFKMIGGGDDYEDEDGEDEDGDHGLEETSEDEEEEDPEEEADADANTATEDETFDQRAAAALSVFKPTTQSRAVGLSLWRRQPPPPPPPPQQQQEEEEEDSTADSTADSTTDSTTSNSSTGGSSTWTLHREWDFALVQPSTLSTETTVTEEIVPLRRVGSQSRYSERRYLNH